MRRHVERLGRPRRDLRVGPRRGDAARALAGIVVRVDQVVRRPWMIGVRLENRLQERPACICSS